MIMMIAASLILAKAAESVSSRGITKLTKAKGSAESLKLVWQARAAINREMRRRQMAPMPIQPDPEEAARMRRERQDIINERNR